MKDFLAKLYDEGLPSSSLCLAALGPKMIELARDRIAGARPYLVTPEHPANARAALSPDALLAPEQGAVPEANPARARELARPHVKGYGAIANDGNSWRRLGFSESDIAEASDSLVDALSACGTGSIRSASKRIFAGEPIMSACRWLARDIRPISACCAPEGSRSPPHSCSVPEILPALQRTAGDGSGQAGERQTATCPPSI